MAAMAGGVPARVPKRDATASAHLAVRPATAPRLALVARRDVSETSMAGAADPAYASDASARIGLNPRALARALAYVEAHLGEALALADIAAAANVSRFHFARLFRLSTGSSPMAYVLRLRIERAQRLLRAGSHKIADIAATLGFFDQSHFARTFRRLTGHAPRDFARSAGARAHGACRQVADLCVPTPALAGSSL